MSDQPQTTPPVSAFAVIDVSGRIDPMSVRWAETTCVVYAHRRGLTDYRVVPVEIIVAGVIERLKAALTNAEAEARRYANFYPQSSDGRNTFILLADRIAELANV